jgi:hypothetical protein
MVGIPPKGIYVCRELMFSDENPTSSFLLPHHTENAVEKMNWAVRSILLPLDKLDNRFF